MLIVGVLVWRDRPQGRYSQILMAARALEARPVEARVAGLPYAPFVRSRGADERLNSAPMMMLHGAAGNFLLDAKGDTLLRERGVATLLAGNATDAVELLERAARQPDAGAEVFSDLAAARIAAADASDDTHLFASALASADAAIRHDARDADALFNRALALEHLRLHEPAVAAYRDFLAVDPNTPWAAEAHRRIALCTYETEAQAWARTAPELEKVPLNPERIARAVHDFPQQCRATGETVYLSRWADAVRTGKPEEAEHMLSLARQIGADLRAETGESLLAHAVASIEGADHNRKETLVAAYGKYVEGRKLLAVHHSSDASTPLNRAQYLFAAAGSPMALIAAFYAANAAIDVGRDDEAGSLLHALRVSIPQRYGSIAGQVAKEEGVVLSRQGRVHEGLERTASASAVFERLRERIFKADSEISTAAEMSSLGKPADAWQLRGAIFAEVSRSGDTITFDKALNSAARDEMRDGNPRVAEAILNVLLQRPLASARVRIDALLCRLQSMSPDEIARGALTLSNIAVQIPDAAVRAEALDDVRLAEASAIAGGDARRAVQLASATITFRTERHDAFGLPEAFLARARALRNARKDDEAIRDYLHALTLTEEQRQSRLREEISNDRRVAGAGAYEELIELQIGRRDYVQAFETAAREAAFRAASPTASSPDDFACRIESVRSRLPPSTVLLLFRALPDRLVAFTVTSAGIHTYTAGIGFQKLAALSDALRRATVRRDDPAAATISSQLYVSLIAPIEPELASSAQVVIVPDDLTASIPFAALQNPATGDYFVQEHAITVAPAPQTYFARQHERAAAERVLVVADPEFSRSLFPRLPRLPEAEAEAQNIEALFPLRTTLVARAASRRAVIGAIGSADVIHIAAHAVNNSRDDSLAALPLTPTDDDEGALYGRDIAALRLTRAPLVVLAGCGTAAGYSHRLSLTSSFLTAGARSVIGTLWDVDDDLAAELAAGIEARVARGESAAVALRNVQLQMIRSSDARRRSARNWSSFEVFGSGH